MLSVPARPHIYVGCMEKYTNMRHLDVITYVYVSGKGRANDIEENPVMFYLQTLGTLRNGCGLRRWGMKEKIVAVMEGVDDFTASTDAWTSKASKNMSATIAHFITPDIELKYNRFLLCINND